MWILSRRATLVLALSAAPARVHAQTAEPSRAEQYLAVGRLQSAEKELYAAVRAAPRQSAPRGALARYLASRGRFKIAQVLLEEALRFGADTGSVARALAEMAPYRPTGEVKAIPGLRPPAPILARDAARRERGYIASFDGAAVTVPMVMTEDALTLLRFTVRTTHGTATAVVDPLREGVALGSAEDATFAPHSFGDGAPGSPLLIPEFFVADRRLAWLDATVDPTVPPGEIRLGLDIFWQLRPIVDEPRERMTLPELKAKPRVLTTTQRIPMMLGFPGLWLVPRAYQAPVAIESPLGRQLLRGTRWQIDPAAAVVNVDR